MNGEQAEVNLLVTSVFDELGIPYCLGGSLASSTHGIYRATNCADFIAALSIDQVHPFVDLLGRGFYADADSIVEEVRHSRSFNVIHLGTMLKIDVFVMKGDPFSREQMDRRVRVPLGEPPTPEIFVASPKDTILSKLEWYRLGGEVSDRQWNDILGVLKVQGDRLDFDYLDRWADELSVADLLKRAREDAGV